MKFVPRHPGKILTLLSLSAFAFCVAGCSDNISEDFLNASAKSQANTCIDNLRQIEGACEQCKMEGEIPSAENIYGPGKYIKTPLKCPSVPKKPYVIPTGDERPKCPNEDRYPSHKLPDSNY